MAINSQQLAIFFVMLANRLSFFLTSKQDNTNPLASFSTKIPACKRVNINILISSNE